MSNIENKSDENVLKTVSDSFSPVGGDEDINLSKSNTKYSNLYNLKNKKISRLIWDYSIPAIIGTTVNALYNITDRVFIGNAPGIAEKGMTSIGMLLPIMAIIAAFGMLVGIGAGSRISLHLGKGDKKTAEEILGTSLLLSIIISIIVTSTLFSLTDKIIALLHATKETETFARQFIQIYLPGTIFSTLCFSFNNMMRASGYPKKAMYTMILTVVVNVILAPIFIFVFNWGMRGAALATVCSMIVGSIFVLQHFISGKNNLKLRWKNIRFNKKIVVLIISIGLSPFMIQLVASGLIFKINSTLQEYEGEIAVSAYTIVNALLLLIVMIITGLTQGMQPIVGYNFGAGDLKRVKETITYVVKVGIGIGFIGLILGNFFPFIITDPFNPSTELKEFATTALKFTTLTLPLAGIQIVIASFFQCIGMVKKAIFLSLTRQLFIFLPALIFLPKFFGLNGVWFSFSVADTVSVVITILIFLKQMQIFNRMAKDGIKINIDETDSI